jgi:hypothetical protein
MSNPNPETLFLAIGLEPKFVGQTLKNQKVTQSLLEVLQLANVSSSDKKTGQLFFYLFLFLFFSLSIHNFFP